jgi:peroxiredoxin
MISRRPRWLLYGALAISAWAADTARTAPPFTMLRVNEPSVSLSQYRGKVVALVFISLTCNRCQQVTTELNQLAPDYLRRGVQIVVCAFDEDATLNMREFLERFNPPYPVTYSAPAAVSVFLQRTMFDQRPRQVPYLVLIDHTGVIRAEFPPDSEFFKNPGPNLRAHLDKILGGVDKR